MNASSTFSRLMIVRSRIVERSAGLPRKTAMAHPQEKITGIVSPANPASVWGFLQLGWAGMPGLFVHEVTSVQCYEVRFAHLFFDPLMSLVHEVRLC